jgi:hypothetical protein
MSRKAPTSAVQASHIGTFRNSDLGYLAKNVYGEYTLKRKANIKEYVLLGHRPLTKIWLYSMLSLATLIVELSVS